MTFQKFAFAAICGVVVFGIGGAGLYATSGALKPAKGQKQTKVEVTVITPDVAVPEAPKVAKPVAKEVPRTMALDDGNRVAIASPSGTKAWAYDYVNRVWSVYKAPEGMTVGVVNIGSIYAVVTVSGAPIVELAAFSNKSEGWAIQPLRGRVGSKGGMSMGFTPFTTSSCALYRIGRHAYGFSSHTGTWDVLDLDEDSYNSHVLAFQDSIVLASGDKLYEFNPEIGKFKDAEEKKAEAK